MFDVDWTAAWLAPYRELGAPLHRRILAGQGVAQALGERFVPASALPCGEPYEAFVARTGQVPTRDNAHDFFNGLVWLHHPALKARLNRWHALTLEVHGVHGRRGPLRDAATVFDENGALLEAPPELAAALVARDWRRLFVTLRPLWREARVTVVGHALLEKLGEPRKPHCAHVLLAEPLEAAAFAVKPFHPLPVLGVPGWWPANEMVDFYEDPAVFRGRRLAQTG
ncbi:MAG: DUF3025 domain-containing protein [Paucibacter sp.]|nr:DUF3025 domain-containing protein [Roseateles sp.]